MSQQPAVNEDVPRIPIYWSGPMPHSSAWCATCAMLYAGELSADVATQEYVKEQHHKAADEGQHFCMLNIAEPDDMQLQPAITVAPSMYFDVPMPVCWTHIKGFRFPRKGETQAIQQQSPLITTAQERRTRQR